MSRFLYPYKILLLDDHCIQGALGFMSSHEDQLQYVVTIG